MSIVRVLALAALCVALASAQSVYPQGPWVRATKGEPWPKPQSLVNHDGGFMVVRPSTFAFQVTGQDCDLLEEALKRYFQVIKEHASGGGSRHGSQDSYKEWKKSKDFTGYLDTLQVNLANPCEEYPYLHMDESYELKIDSPDALGEGSLTAQSVWGILRGLETFSQLLSLDDNGIALAINSSTTVDFPRFPHRGLLLDTARHFFPMRYIEKTLEAMEYNKFNVLHWHIVDDASFPYQSAKFPEISEQGAYHPLSQVYSRLDVRHVIEYARLRGIRVIPEFDTPGHTFSWAAIPNLLTPCYDVSGEPNGRFGPMNPILESTYTFVREFFDEIVNVFPDSFFHIGGDEVQYECWRNNPDINDYMAANNFTGDYDHLLEIYIQQAVDITSDLNATSVVWQEVLDSGVNVPSDTIVHVWTLDQEAELLKVTEKGYGALLSTCWYLDHLKSGGDWKGFYACEPTAFNGTPEQKALVMGGEACMWTEFVDSSNLESRVWPRASATAEKLWSSIDTTDDIEAARRLEEHYCRMKRRGINAQPPNGPGYCL